MRTTFLSSEKASLKAPDEKFSLTQKLKIPELIDRLKEALEQLNTKKGALHVHEATAKGNKSFAKLPEEIQHTLIDSRLLAEMAITHLTTNITVLEEIIQNEQELISSRIQEEVLDKNSKWRSFWLRVGTTASTFIVAILLLNAALWVGLKVPRILTPNEPPTSTQQAHLNDLIKANNKTVPSVKTTLPKKESSGEPVVTNDIPLPGIPDKKIP